jgi:hypothetical protein
MRSIAGKAVSFNAVRDTSTKVHRVSVEIARDAIDILPSTERSILFSAEASCASERISADRLSCESKARDLVRGHRVVAVVRLDKGGSGWVAHTPFRPLDFEQKRRRHSVLAVGNEVVVAAERWVLSAHQRGGSDRQHDQQQQRELTGHSFRFTSERERGE